MWSRVWNNGLLRAIAFATLGLVCAAAATLLIDWRISTTTASRVFSRVEETPARPAALVLGTSPYAFGRRNLFYEYRLDAAAELFHAGRVRAILVSGDNSRDDYDEPSAMKEDLVERGVPAEFVTCDYGGFRTLDSVVRASKVFGLERYVVVSQGFHVERALYIAQAQGHDAIGYHARGVGGRFGLRVRLREAAARLQAFLDVHVLGTQPKFLGKREAVVYETE